MTLSEIAFSNSLAISTGIDDSFSSYSLITLSHNNCFTSSDDLSLTSVNDNISTEFIKTRD